MQISKITYKEFTKSVILFFALLISFWIPQYKFSLALFIVLWFIFSLVQFNYIKRFKDNFSKQKLVFILLEFLFFVIIIGGYFISDDKGYAKELIIKKLSFFVFPVLFFLSGKSFAKRKYLFLKLFVLGNIIASLLSIFRFLYFSFSLKEGSVTFYPFAEDGNPLYTYSNFSIFHHPAYFSMYLVFSIIILFYLKKNSKCFIAKKRKIIFYSVLVLFISIIFLLSSRAGIFSLFIYFIYSIIGFIYKTKSLKLKIASVLIVIISLVILSQNYRVMVTYDRVTEAIKKGKKSDIYPLRLILWEASVEVIEDNFWLGTGTGDAISELTKKTEFYNIREDKIRGLNTHNQFLDTFLSSGIIGFLVLFTLIVYSFFIAIIEKDKLFVLFLSLVSFNFLFESMLNTIAGIVFGLYFLNYFVFVFEHKKSQITK